MTLAALHRFARDGWEGCSSWAVLSPMPAPCSAGSPRGCPLAEPVEIDIVVRDRRWHRLPRTKMSISTMRGRLSRPAKQTARHGRMVHPAAARRSRQKSA